MQPILATFERAATQPLAYARQWKQANGRPVIGILPMHFPGELAHAAGALPIVLQEDELRSWRWCDASGVEERTTPFMARRLTAALAARAEGATVELEDGYPVA